MTNPEKIDLTSKYEENRQVRLIINEQMYQDLKEIAEYKNKPLGQLIRSGLGDYISKAKLKGWL